MALEAAALNLVAICTMNTRWRYRNIPEFPKIGFARAGSESTGTFSSLGDARISDAGALFISDNFCVNKVL